MSESRCTAMTRGGGRGLKVLRCQGDEGHPGRCHYHFHGGQGGSTIHWWGANPRPVEYVEDLTVPELAEEVRRLRELCDRHGIDWRAALVEIDA